MGADFSSGFLSSHVEHLRMWYLHGIGSLLVTDLRIGFMTIPFSSSVFWWHLTDIIDIEELTILFIMSNTNVHNRLSSKFPTGICRIGHSIVFVNNAQCVVQLYMYIYSSSRIVPREVSNWQSGYLQFNSTYPFIPLCTKGKQRISARNRHGAQWFFSELHIPNDALLEFSLLVPTYWRI